jgi:hypothetical protein
MIPKREKYPMDISSYTPISVLPTISKVPEKNVYPKKKSINTGRRKTGTQNNNLHYDRLNTQRNNATA